MESKEKSILDSGQRREFCSGAVRDVQEGKGRCDLLPLMTISTTFKRNKNETVSDIFCLIDNFIHTGFIDYLYEAIDCYIQSHEEWDYYSAILELAIHYEQGAKKYAERNWEKGIPLHCFIDSGIRHLLKYYRGDQDEPHDRAFLWNMFGAIWTRENYPELNDLPINDELER